MRTLIFLLFSAPLFAQVSGPVIKPGDVKNESYGNCDTIVASDTVVIDTMYFSTVGSDTVITTSYRYSTKNERVIDTLTTNKDNYIDSLTTILAGRQAQLEYMVNYHYTLFLIARTELLNVTRFKEEYEELINP